MLTKEDSFEIRNTELEIGEFDEVETDDCPPYEPPDISENLAEARALVAGIREDPAIFSASGIRVAACDLLTQALDAIERRVLDSKDKKETTS